MLAMLTKHFITSHHVPNIHNDNEKVRTLSNANYLSPYILTLKALILAISSRRGCLNNNTNKISQRQIIPIAEEGKGGEKNNEVKNKSKKKIPRLKNWESKILLR